MDADKNTTPNLDGEDPRDQIISDLVALHIRNAKHLPKKDDDEVMGYLRRKDLMPGPFRAPAATVPQVCPDCNGRTFAEVHGSDAHRCVECKKVIWAEASSQDEIPVAWLFTHRQDAFNDDCCVVSSSNVERITFEEPDERFLQFRPYSNIRPVFFTVESLWEALRVTQKS